MSVVNIATGEVIDLDRAAAERRAERIRLRLDVIADNYTAVMPMIREAIEKRDDMALGYRSVSEYVADRFGGALQNLGMDVRREVVRELTQTGMSTRAIAPIVGVSKDTVQRDQIAGVSRETPAPQTPEPATEGEAETGPGQTPGDEGDSASGAGDPATTEATPGVNRPEDCPEAPAPAPRPPAPVIGIDGKNYSRPTPKSSEGKATPRRRPLPDAFFDAVYDTRKTVERLHRLCGDDRFPQNAEQVAARHRGDLFRIKDLLEQVLSNFDTEEHTHD